MVAIFVAADSTDPSSLELNSKLDTRESSGIDTASKSFGIDESEVEKETSLTGS